MMGPRQVAQGALFYEFSIEGFVPQDHPMRGIDRFLDLTDVRLLLSPFYSSHGRPSIDPELMIRMLLFGYCQGIRSERRLCEEVHVNLAYRWFCRLDLADPLPDHSTFSKNRHGRFRESGLFRHLFETVLQRCIDEGLVGGHSFGVDASLIPANANQTRGVDSKDGLPPELTSHAVDEYLETLRGRDGRRAPDRPARHERRPASRRLQRRTRTGRGPAGRLAGSRARPRRRVRPVAVNR